MSGNGSSYLDLDDILSEEELVKSRFNGDIPASPTYASDQESPMSAIISEILLNGVEKSTILELPWWLASTLLQVNFVDISLPRAFNQRSREALQMGPWATNLCELSPFFYRFSIKLLPVVADPVPLYQLVVQTFLQRSKEIIRLAMNGTFSDQLAIMEKLEDSEKKILGISRHAL
ncbi:DNA replication complex GINS protein PSF3 [Mitosporidium daphniae]